MGGDVYDVGRYVWCDLCEAPHEACEPPDLTFECCNCNAPLPDATSDDPTFPMLECDDCRLTPENVDSLIIEHPTNKETP